MVNLEVLEVFFCQKVHFRGLEAFRGFRGKSGHPGDEEEQAETRRKPEV